MKKYQCNACEINICTAEYQGGREVPFKCTGIFDMYHKPQWKEVAELPRLTAKVFDRPDCPEWAQYAALDINGIACFYGKKPKCDNIRMWLSENNRGHFMVIKGNKYDASDWQNSLIKRPATLPEWCKVGEWVFVDPGKVFGLAGYKKIKATDGLILTFADGCCVYFSDKIKQARIRQYNSEEMRGLVGKVVQKGRNLYLVSAYIEKQQSIIIASLSSSPLNAELLIINNMTIDGKLCYVLEHLENGEWVR